MCSDLYLFALCGKWFAWVRLVHINGVERKEMSAKEDRSYI